MLTGMLPLMTPVLRQGHLCIFKQCLLSRPRETPGTPIPRFLLCFPTWRWCSPSPSHKVIRPISPPHRVSRLFSWQQGRWLSSSSAPLLPLCLSMPTGCTVQTLSLKNITSNHLKCILRHAVGYTSRVISPCTDTSPPTASLICRVSAQCLFLLKQRRFALPPRGYKKSL